MTTTEKLTRIRARCVELLALAEKRTPGKWIATTIDPFGHDYREPIRVMGEDTAIATHCGSTSFLRSHDAAYIAACAGAAEAGWKATIAAIDGLAGMLVCGVPNPQALALRDAILAAWPEDLL